MANGNNDTAKSFFRWLDVIRAISGDRILSAPDIAKILGTSLRNAYYVIKALSAYGFFVNHNKLGYNLDAASPFFRDINESVSLNVDQAFFLYRMLIGKDMDNPMAAKIMLKFKRFYHFDVLGGSEKNFLYLRARYHACHHGRLEQRLRRARSRDDHQVEVVGYEQRVGLCGKGERRHCRHEECR